MLFFLHRFENTIIFALSEKIHFLEFLEEGEIKDRLLGKKYLRRDKNKPKSSAEKKYLRK